jgi:hypothetical protein
VIHHRAPDRTTPPTVSAGWHMHLDTLAPRLNGKTQSSFWEGWKRLKAGYEARLPA